MSTIVQLESHAIFNTVPTILEQLKLIENEVDFLKGLTEYGMKTLNRIRCQGRL
jgi:hypothetical protein